MQYDIEQAKKCYIPKWGYVGTDCFGKYSPSYVATNESYRPVLNFVSPKNNRVLATMGSGDWPLYYYLFGAKSVDAFDVSYCANAMFHMKKSAIKKFDLPQYHKMLCRVFDNGDLQEYSDVINDCPDEVRNFINGMHGCQIFANGLAPELSDLVTSSEYNILKDKISNIEVPFIWSDLESLSSKLKKSYDIIYLSNIFQYEANGDKITKIVNSLRPYLNKDGIMIVFNGDWLSSDRYKYDYMSNQVKNWANTMIIDRVPECTVFLQKTR